MKHRLSFGNFNLLDDNILEVTVDEGIEMTLEMIDECHQFIESHISGDFGMLINRINDYTYSYEAKLSIASYEGLKALAFVYYSAAGEHASKKLSAQRKVDEWNFQIFSGLELGWSQAYQWLKNELVSTKVNH